MHFWAPTQFRNQGIYRLKVEEHFTGIRKMVVYTATISVSLFLTTIMYLKSYIHTEHTAVLSPQYHHIFSLKLCTELSSQLCGCPRCEHRLDVSGFTGADPAHPTPLRPSPATCMCIFHLSCTILTMQRRLRSRVTP